MAVHALDNRNWGFESSCFVCEPSNERGLKIPFFHDDDAHVVQADFTLDATFSGAPTYVHGGVSLAIMDEAMAWATIAIAKAFAVTQTTKATFFRPVRVDRPYHVQARIASQSSECIQVRATVSTATRKPCVEAEASFIPLSAEQAGRAIGGEVAGDAARYVRP